MQAMFLPHHSTVISESETAPSKWMIMMHGIYGRGGNWRTVARKVVGLRPDWGILLVDLRMHGKSQAAPSPHTLASCASDVLALIDQQREQGRNVGSILGHSFGGKVALEMRLQRPNLGPLWLIDSAPGARSGAMDDSKNTVVSVLKMLRQLPKTFADRDAFVSAVKSYGFGPIAQWLAMNLEACPEGYRNSLDPAAMTELLEDYFARDLWPAITASSTTVHVAAATRGSSISEADRARLAEAPQVKLHHVEGGHWLHVDALVPLVELVAASLE